MPDNARARRNALRQRLVNPHPVLYAFAILCDGKSKTTVMNSDFDETVAAAIAAKAQPTDRVHIWKYIQMGKAATVCLTLLLGWSLGMAQVQPSAPAPNGRYFAEVKEQGSPDACTGPAILEDHVLETAYGDRYNLSGVEFLRSGTTWYYASKFFIIALTPASPLSEQEETR